MNCGDACKLWIAREIRTTVASGDWRQPGPDDVAEDEKEKMKTRFQIAPFPHHMRFMIFIVHVDLFNINSSNITFSILSQNLSDKWSKFYQNFANLSHITLSET